MARSKDSASCSPFSEKAVRFCALGALRRAAYDLTGNETTALRLTTMATRALLGGGLQLFAINKLVYMNDARGHEAVLALFDKALEAP